MSRPRSTPFPSPEARRSRIVGWCGLALLILVMLGLSSNYYLATHRTVHVVNGTDRAVTVEVPPHAAVTVQPNSRVQLVLPEGSHQAQVAGSTNIAFSFRTRFWSRWFEDPPLILNVEGAALLLWERVGHGQFYLLGHADEWNLYYGQPFLNLGAVDYAFQEFPDEITGRSDNLSTVYKTRVDLCPNPIEQVVYEWVGKRAYAKAMDLVEWRLESHPESVELLPSYLSAAQMAQLEPRATQFLAKQIQDRSVNVHWHRAYQDSRAADATQLIEEYDALLRSTPNNASHLYLRGRLAPTILETVSRARQALAADPDHPFAHYLLGTAWASIGDWAQARPPLDHALQLQPACELFWDRRFEVMLGLGAFEELERELLDALADEPLHYNYTRALFDVLLTQGREADAEQLLADYTARLLQQFGREAEIYTRPLRYATLYAAGRFDTLAEESEYDPTPSGLRARFEAAVETGEVLKADKMYPIDAPDSVDPTFHLALAIALQDAGYPGPAERRRQRALDLCTQGRSGYQSMAKLLQQSRPIPIREAMQLSLPAKAKSIFLAAAARSDPTHATEIVEAIRRLNVDRSFPYHLIQRCSAKLTSP